MLTLAAPALAPVLLVLQAATGLPPAPPQTIKPLDDVTYEAVIASSAARVEQSLRERQDLYWSIATTVGAVLVGVLAFLGYGQIKSVRDGLSEDVIRQLSNSAAFKDTIANQIEDSVLRSLKEAQLAIERQIDFLNVRSIAEGLESAESFSGLQRDSLFDGLLRLKDDPVISKRPEFLSAVDQTFSSFFQAGLWDKIDALEVQLRQIALTNPGLVQSLIPSLGYRILSESEVSTGVHAGLLMYLKAAKDLRFPEAAYPFEFAYNLHVKPPGWERRIEIAFADAKSMATRDLSVCLRRMDLLSRASGIARNPRAYHERIAAKFQAVLDQYPEQVAMLRTELAGRPDREPPEPA